MVLSSITVDSYLLSNLLQAPSCNRPGQRLLANRSELLKVRSYAFKLKEEANHEVAEFEKKSTYSRSVDLVCSTDFARYRCCPGLLYNQFRGLHLEPHGNNRLYWRASCCLV